MTQTTNHQHVSTIILTLSSRHLTLNDLVMSLRHAGIKHMHGWTSMGVVAAHQGTSPSAVMCAQTSGLERCGWTQMGSPYR